MIALARFFSGCVLLCIICLGSCHEKKVSVSPPLLQTWLIHELNEQLSEAIIQDGFSPPVAARIYAYANIAAYEAARILDTSFVSFAQQLNDPPILPPLQRDGIDCRIAMIRAFTRMSTSIVYRDYIMEKKEQQLLDSLMKENISESVVAASLAYGDALCQALTVRAKRDGYIETRNKPLYEPLKSPSSWVPTPPSYTSAMEPYWNEITPFILDSASQFAAPPPPVFSADKQSEFFRLAEEVYQTGNTLDEEKKNIVRHWDDNPFISNVKGHLIFARRQLTPGGHWMGIARQACVHSKKNLVETCQIYAMTAIALSDGFISCWDEKYRSNLIRPETYINEYIEPLWRPFLESPPFPEYTSGHSVISAAAATVLADMFGELSFIDSVNVPFGLPPRKMDSFSGAAMEAGISRLYGGIHYRPAVEIGNKQGMEVGRYILSKVHLRQTEPSQD